MRIYVCAYDRFPLLPTGAQISQIVFPTSYLSPPSFILIPSILSPSPPFLHPHPLHPFPVSPHLPVLDRTVKIWDLSATTEVAQLGNHASYVRKVAFCEQSEVFSVSQTTVKGV